MKIREDEGWTRRHSASGERLREAVAEYEELGFEVRVVPAEEAGGEEGCGKCTGTAAPGEPVMVIFTRPSGE
ncbi:hypothetical protein EPN96_01715 [bacterium]|nr:MAG: hypothetical protein EPN96_01715 [bacterium]